MAEVAISFTVEKLGSMLVHKVAFLQGVAKEVKWLKEELQRMQCFLKDAEEKQGNDELIRKWISDIRDVAQDAEDVIETFILKVDAPRRRSRGLLETCACLPDHVYHLDMVGEEIESIRSRLKNISKGCDRYGIQSLGERTMTTMTSSEGVQWRRQLSHWQKDKDVVGLEADVESVLHNIVFTKRKGLVIGSIVGMGGIGKSTLARIVYNNDTVVNQFERRAWVCISSEFSPKEIIKEVVLQLLEPSEDKLKVLEIMERSPLEHLKSMVHERLQGKPYFIILDDVWESAHWQSLTSAFPNEEDKTSILLLTTRKLSVTKDDQIYAHKIKTLNREKSWELFLKKAFTGNNGQCPEELKATARDILQKCNGLPLAITVMGGLLKKHGQSKDEWTKVLKGMNSHLKTGESSVSHIMELSYHDLPPQLKSCFLCLGFFKEDATIRAEKLIQVWIAQGLIPPKEDKDETMEEIARDYLDELINRNMIQVKDTTKDDRVKNCLIHDFLHDLAITKAKEEIRLEILRDEGGGSQSSQKSRHRVIYCGTETPVFSSQKNNHIRSLFFHGHGNNIFGGSTVWKNFQLLRVLDFENAGLEFLPDAIGEIVGLRYLGLRNNDIKELPSSFSRLKNLQVLDISLNFSMEVPNIIWKMISLRHLYMSRITCQASPKVDYLKNLQTLTYIPTPRWTREHTTRMTSLRKLGLELDEKSDIINLFDSLAMLANLLCLNLRWYGNHDILFEDGLRKLPCLTQLKLQGKMTELPTVGNFPPNLSHLSLIHTALDKDPMPVLEKLPKLVYLKLDGAFTGEQMTITRDGLPKLNVLSLRELIKLRKIRVGARGMSDLRRLEIHRCPHLDNLPGELEFMEQLGELKMVTTEEIVSKLRYNHSRIFSRIPSLHLVSVTLKD
ncbi:hypothetical protein ABFS82_14G190600 [Erythranthe guttata]